MEEKKLVTLSPEELEKATGGEWNGHHTCGICGEEMQFAYKQDYVLPAVYKCPRCGNVEPFRY